MSHWADDQENSRGQRVISGLGGPPAHSDGHDDDSEHENGKTAHEGDRHQESGPTEDEHATSGSREARNERALPGIVHSMGKSFGYDFSDVSFAKGMPSVASEHGAKAVASDHSEVAIDLNTVDLHEAEGQKILGSELAHIMQKRKGTVEPDAVDAHLEGQPAPGLAARVAHDKSRRDHLEKEADAAGEKAARGGSASVQSGARAPKNQFWGLGDIWNKAKESTSRVLDTAKKGASWVGDKLDKGAAWAGDKINKGAAWTGDKLDKGAAWAGDKINKGAAWVGDKLDKGASWIGDKINKGAAWAGDKLSKGSAWVRDKFRKGAAWVGDKARKGASWALDKLKKGASWLGKKGAQLYDGVKKKATQTLDDIQKGMKQEGVWGFIKDPVGALDRQQAQRELSNRFQVVPDNFHGPRAPNTVTQAEYQRICHTYSDIRLGRGDLTIDAGAKDKDSGGRLKTQKERDAYRQGALDDIVSMMQTGSGRREIEQLHNNVSHDENGKTRRGVFGVQMPFNLGTPIHHHTTMVPLLKADGTYDRTNGYAAPDGNGDEREVKADGSLGKAGSGTDVHIRYNPGVNTGASMPANLVQANPWLGQMRSDVLLSHEMNHAIKQTSGMVDPRAVQATDNAGNPTDPNMALDASYRWPAANGGGPLRRVEHQAAGIGMYAGDDMTENAYRRERRQLADMHGVGQIPGDDSMVQRNSYTFYPPQPSAPPPGPGPASP
jgi:hypothetical protein